MGFWSSFAGSAGSGIGSGLSTGVNNWIRRADSKWFGGLLGIDDANSHYLYQDTYDSAMANGQANIDLLPALVKQQRSALEGAGYNPLLAISSANPTSAFSGHSIAPSQGSGAADFNDEVREKQKELLDSQIDQVDANTDRTKAETDAIEAGAEAKRAEVPNINADTQLKSTQQWTQPISTIGGSALNGALIYKAIKSAGSAGATKGATSAVKGASKVVPLLLPAAGSSAKAVNIGSKAVNIGSKFLRGLGFLGTGVSLAIPVGKQMYKAQKEAMKNGKTSFTNHMSAGW